MMGMTRLSTGAAAIALSCLWGSPATAQQGSARDLYYSGGGGTNTGNTSSQGAKLSVKLQRDGQTTMVGPDHAFRSGDKVRLVFATNFRGYISVTNVGSSGRRRLIFPLPGETSQIVPSNSYEVPAKGWFSFDAIPGEEKVIVTMSAKPLEGLPVPQPGPGGGSTGGAANPQEEDQILAQLNNRDLANGRDLHYAVDGDEAFALTSGQTLAKPVAFTLVLKHR